MNSTCFSSRRKSAAVEVIIISKINFFKRNWTENYPVIKMKICSIISLLFAAVMTVSVDVSTIVP